MNKKFYIGIGIVALLWSGLLTYQVVKAHHLRDIERVYKDGFRVGRVVGRDDIMLKLKRPDCFTQKLDTIVQDQDAPLIKTLEAEIPREVVVPGNQGKKK